MRYFLKEKTSRPLYLPNGAKAPFESAGGDYGLLETQDSYLVTELDKAVKMHVGGVVALSAEEYNSWVEKKKASEQSSSSSQPKDREILGPIPFQELQRIRAAGAAAVVSGMAPGKPTVVAGPGRAQQQASQQKVEPLATPSQFTKPKVGRIPKAPSTLSPPPPAEHPSPAPISAHSAIAGPEV
jgi:hypothetical protein